MGSYYHSLDFIALLGLNIPSVVLRIQFISYNLSFCPIGMGDPIGENVNLDNKNKKKMEYKKYKLH